jgi:hypothetical protein
MAPARAAAVVGTISEGHLPGRVLSGSARRPLIHSLIRATVGLWLAANLDGLRPDQPGVRLFENLPPRSRGAFLTESAPAAYVTRWLAEIGSLEPPVRAVLGYCAGSSLAAVLAAEKKQPVP